MVNNVSDKLMKARCRLMTKEPWYGHVAMSMVWIPSEMSQQPETQRTMGVRIVNGGEVQCVYYPPFVDNLTIEELYAVVQHEIEHIVRMHCIRVADRQPLVWNVAADMCVNGSKNNPRIGYHDHASNQVIVPLKDKIVWIPHDWPKDETTEYYYERLKNEAAENGIDIDKLDNYGQLLDDHNIWRETDVSEDEARQIIKDIIDQAAEKTQGQVPNHLSSALAKLNKPIVKWRQLLQHYFGKHIGNKRLTYARRNRRRDHFGIPGISKHAAANVNVIVDTSGSISQSELEQFFTEIDSISSRAMTNILQWDSEFQGFKKYRRGDWRRFKINGRGGTDMAAPLLWLEKNRLIADVQVMLTDGFCNYLEAEQVKYPVITVITQSQATGSAVPDYGHIVKMG